MTVPCYWPKHYTYLALQSRDELTILGEDSQVEVVVVVSDGNFSCSIDANTNWIVCNSFNKRQQLFNAFWTFAHYETNTKQICAFSLSRAKPRSLKITRTKIEKCVMLEILQIFLVYYQSFYLLLQFVWGNFLRSQTPWRSVLCCHWWRFLGDHWQQLHWETPDVWSSQTCSGHCPFDQK